MEKGKEPVIYISDNETTTDDSEEEVELNNEEMMNAPKEVELNNGEMMNAPEEKAMSDVVKLAESKEIKRRQANRASGRRWRENEKMYTTNMEKEIEKLKNDNSNTTKRIKLYENEHKLLQIERKSWTRRQQQSLEVNRRLVQECINLENLQQEQSRAPNAAQDPNSMLEPRQIQTSGPSHQHAHQPGGPHNAAYHPSGIMVPQQIQTSGLLHQQAHQPGGPNNAAYHSVGIMVPQQIQTSGSSHQPGGPNNAARHSYGPQEPGMRELGQSSASQKGVYDNPMASQTWVAWVESCINDPDQDVPSPQLSADDCILGSEMPSTVQLQEGMSSTDVEKAKSDAGQINVPGSGPGHE